MQTQAKFLNLAGLTMATAIDKGETHISGAKRYESSVNL